MNTLKKLFGKSTLAATVATGMLLFSTVKALATGWYTVSALSPGYSNHNLECPTTYCVAFCQDQDLPFYWCCGDDWVNSCYPDHNGILMDCNPWDHTLRGWCLDW